MVNNLNLSEDTKKQIVDMIVYQLEKELLKKYKNQTGGSYTTNEINKYIENYLKKIYIGLLR